MTDTAKHILAKNVHCIDPDTNVQRGSWDDWVMEESMRRFVSILLSHLIISLNLESRANPSYCPLKELSFTSMEYRLGLKVEEESFER